MKNNSANLQHSPPPPQPVPPPLSTTIVMQEGGFDYFFLCIWFSLTQSKGCVACRGHTSGYPCTAYILYSVRSTRGKRGTVFCTALNYHVGATRTVGCVQHVFNKTPRLMFSVPYCTVEDNIMVILCI